MPDGIFEMPPGRARFIRRIETALLEAFRKWGYQEVRTPALEYADTMLRALEDEELDLAFKLVDRATGKTMVLRSDLTPQVARMAAIGMRHLPRPLRLCYISSVYRHSDDPSYPRREIIQAGAELVGLGDPQADAEMVAMAVAAMDELGLPGFRMSLGQVQYAGGLLAESGLDEAAREEVLAAAVRKDGSRIREVLTRDGAGAAIIDATMALVELSGGHEVLEKARKQAPNRQCADAVDNLETILGLATSYGVDPGRLHVDLGELASFRYHTGLVFTGYTLGTGKAVLSGGRYDDLVGRFGDPEPSTGFAIDVLEAADIISAAAGPDPVIDYLVVNRTGERERGLRFSMDLRRRGRNVLCLIRGMTDRELAGYARAHRIRSVLVLTEDGRVLVLDEDTGTMTERDVSEL